MSLLYDELPEPLTNIWTFFNQRINLLKPLHYVNLKPIQGVKLYKHTSKMYSLKLKWLAFCFYEYSLSTKVCDFTNLSQFLNRNRNICYCSVNLSPQKNNLLEKLQEIRICCIHTESINFKKNRIEYLFSPN